MEEVFLVINSIYQGCSFQTHFLHTLSVQHNVQHCIFTSCRRICLWQISGLSLAIPWVGMVLWPLAWRILRGNPVQTCTHTHTHSRDTQSRFWFALKECTRKAHSCQGYRFGPWMWLRMLRYSSVSAFAPICNPTKVPWGQKAFKFYLGSDEQVQRRNCHGV